MLKKLNKKTIATYLFLLLVYLVIFFQYPFGLVVGKFVFNLNLYESIKPEYLILWGMVRVLVVLPLTFSLINYVEKDRKSIYLQFGDKNRMISFAFWGTLLFTLIGSICYPVFIKETKLTVDTFFILFPIFSLYSISNAFVEETFFRGSFLTILTEKNSFWISNLIQSFLFGLIHIINPMSSNLFLFVLLTFILGIIWGWMTKKTKSLIPAILLHIVADFFVAISLF